MKKITGFIIAWLFVSVYASAQTIQRLEYYIDADPGYGNGIAVSITPSANIIDQLIPVDISSLSKGFHNVYLRSKDNSGNWSMTNRWLFVKDAVATTINKLEYFIDTDPGFDNGTNVSITAGSNVTNVAIPVDVSALSNGFHTMYLRSKDDAGNWSLSNRWLFVKDVASVNVNKLEYFIDTDPGFGNGNNVSITAGSNVTNVAIPVDVSAWSDGFHTIYLRSKDDAGSWSLTNRWIFLKDIAQNNLQRGEYFFDTDPGFGNGTAIPFSGSLGTDVADFSFGASIGFLSAGNHYLFIRTQETNGRWSLTNVMQFNRSIPLPVTLLDFTARASGEKALLNWQTAMENNNDRFEIERSSNEVTFIKIGQIPGAGNSNALLSYQYIDEHPLKGNNYYRLKQIDIDGKSNYSTVRLVNFKDHSYFIVLNNPTSGTPVIIKTEALNSTLSIFDESGKKIKDLSVSSNTISIPVDQLSNGVYILVLHKEGTVKAVERFVIAR